MNWVSDIQKLFKRMRTTNINIQIISLSFAKKQSEVPVVPLKYKIILAKTTTGLFTDMYINNYAM